MSESELGTRCPMKRIKLDLAVAADEGGQKFHAPPVGDPPGDEGSSENPSPPPPPLPPLPPIDPTDEANENNSMDAMDGPEDSDDDGKGN